MQLDFLLLKTCGVIHFYYLFCGNRLLAKALRSYDLLAKHLDTAINLDELCPVLLLVKD